MLGLGSSVSKSGKAGPTIIRDGLVLKHDYNAGAVEPCSTGAAYFDGTDDYINMGDVCDLGTADFSIALWIWTSDVDDNFFISKHQDDDDEWYMRIGQATNNNNGKIQFHSVVTAAGTEISGLSGTQGAIKANEWTHLAITNDRSDTSAGLKFYINGVADGTEACSTINMDNTGSLHISRYHNSYYSNYLCNVGIWSAALTQAQIKSIMHKDYASLSASEKTGLVSWWNLDSVIDSVGAATAVYDNHYAGGNKLGTELVTDGSFANGLDSWSSANVTLSGSSVILYDDDADYVFQSMSYTDGEVYAFTFEGTGNVQNRIGYTGTAATKIPVTLPATIYRLADSNANRVQLYGAADDSSATVTSVSVKLVNGNTGTLA